MTAAAVEQDPDLIIDPVTGELIDERELAQHLLAEAKSRECPWSGRAGCSPR
nr:hypothetical protein [Xylanimonas cellulosilytica]